jgi:hypothetical protein
MSKQEFWFLSWTWGFIMTFIGFIVFTILRIAGYKTYQNQYSLVCEIGENWGGLEIGPYIIINKNPSQYILNHEFGHSLQNCYFGPFMLLISFMSAIRYWYRHFLIQVKKVPYSILPEYDDIWFEGTATYLGNFYKQRYNS